MDLGESSSRPQSLGCATVDGAPAPETYMGVGIKIPQKFISDHPKLIYEWIAHFRKHMIHYPVIGYDSQWIKADEGEHFHIHFLSKHTHDQLDKRRQKFKLKLGAKMKVYYSKNTLGTLADCLEFLGYAGKEELKDYPHGKDSEHFTASIFGELITLEILDPYVKCARRKKEQKYNKWLKEYKEKQLKKDRKEVILEYLGNQNIQISNSLDEIYVELIKWQSAENSYLQNFYMKEIAHIFIQRNREKLGLDYYDLVRLRNL